MFALHLTYQVNAMSDSALKDTILADFNACYESGPKLAMVDSGKGITKYVVCYIYVL
jgi:monomeric isocitrate dehydrogenase